MMLKDPYRPLPDHAAPVEDGRLSEGDAETYPGQSERRLSLRLINYWRHLRDDNEFAPFSRIEPSLIPDIWPFGFILGVADGRSDGKFRHVGETIARLSGVPVAIAAHVEVPENSLLGKSSSYIEQVVRRRCPITIGGEFDMPDGTTILYRSAIVPLSEDGTAIDAVFGAGNCKTKGQ